MGPQATSQPSRNGSGKTEGHNRCKAGAVRWKVIFAFDLREKQMLVHVSLELKNYIAHPFWPERNRCIEIEKKSGVNRQKSEEKRVAALKAECTRQGVTYEQYLELREKAADQWYRRDGKIIIPRHQIAGSLVQTIASSPKALRGPFDKDNFRALVAIGDFTTERTKADGVFGRFVKLEGSNQRSWQENEFIGQYLDAGSPFTAEGTIDVIDHRQVDTVKALLEAVVDRVGIGAARKMGFGRGKVLTWNV